MFRWGEDLEVRAGTHEIRKTDIILENAAG